MRKKIPIDKKKKSWSVTLNTELLDKLEELLESKGLDNKSKYIESLIKKDMSDRGLDVSEEF